MMPTIIENSRRRSKEPQERSEPASVSRAAVLAPAHFERVLADRHDAQLIDDTSSGNSLPDKNNHRELLQRLPDTLFAGKGCRRE